MYIRNVKHKSGLPNLLNKHLAMYCHIMQKLGVAKLPEVQ